MERRFRLPKAKLPGSDRDFFLFTSVTVASFRCTGQTPVRKKISKIWVRWLVSYSEHICNKCGLTPSSSDTFRVLTPLKCFLTAFSETDILSSLETVMWERDGRSLTEFTGVQRLPNHVNFPTHQCGGSLGPVHTNLSSDCVLCRPLDRVNSSDHHAVFTTIILV